MFLFWCLDRECILHFYGGIAFDQKTDAALICVTKQKSLDRIIQIEKEASRKDHSCMTRLHKASRMCTSLDKGSWFVVLGAWKGGVLRGDGWKVQISIVGDENIRKGVKCSHLWKHWKPLSYTRQTEEVLYKLHLRLKHQRKPHSSETKIPQKGHLQTFLHELIRYKWESG